MSVIGGADLDRRPAGALAGDRHHARHALRDEIEAALAGHRPGAAEARDLAIDEAGIDGLGRHVVAEPELLHRALAIVLDQRVGGCAPGASGPPGPCGFFRSSGQPALVAVHHHEGGGLALDRRRAHLPAVVADRVRSILMTSAPMSASIRPHTGPAITWLRSSTRMPASGPWRCSRVIDGCPRRSAPRPAAAAPDSAAPALASRPSSWAGDHFGLRSLSTISARTPSGNSPSSNRRTVRRYSTSAPPRARQGRARCGWRPA